MRPRTENRLKPVPLDDRWNLRNICPSPIVFIFEQLADAARWKMVLLWLPYTFCLPGIRTLSNADRRRLHGINRNASSAPLGQAVLEACPWQRRGLHVSGPHSRSGGHWGDSVSDTESQGNWHDASLDRLRWPGHDGLLSPHAGPQDAEDQPLHRAVPDFLGGI